MVPIFLAALLAVRGLPAITYRDFVGGARARIAGILQATSLPFIVAATTIGQELGLMDAAESSALIAAGLLSVLIFPITGSDPACDAPSCSPQAVGCTFEPARAITHRSWRPRVADPQIRQRRAPG